MELEALCTSTLFDLSRTAARPLLEGTEYPWQALSGIGGFIKELGASLPAGEYEQRGEDVWVHKTAVIFPHCH